jgi:hypothetical protein
MPFDFGDVAEFGFDDFDVSNFDAIDLSSVVDTTGAEFLTSSDLTSFNVPYEDIGGFGGYQEIGNLGGDAAWYDTWGGEILVGPESALTPGYGFPLDLESPVGPGYGFPLDLESPVGPSFVDQLQSFATQVQTDFSGFIKGAQQAVAAYQKVAPVVNIVTAALKIPNPINALVQPFQQIVGVASAVSQGAGAVRSVANAVSTPGSTTSSSSTGYRPVVSGVPVVESVAPRSVEGIADQTPAGVATGQLVTSAGVPADAPFRELSIEETQQLIARNVDPRLINSADSGLPGRESYDTAVLTQTELSPEIERLSDERREITRRLITNDEKINDLREELDNPALSERARDEISQELIFLATRNGELEQAQFDVDQTLDQARQQLVRADGIIASTDAGSVAAPVGIPVPVGLTASDVRLVTNARGVTTSVTSQSYNTAVQTRNQLRPELELYQNELLQQEITIQNETETLNSLQAALADPNLTDEERQTLEFEIITTQDNIARLEQDATQSRESIASTAQQLQAAETVIDSTNAAVVPSAQPLPAAPGSRYQTVYNQQANTWSIRDVTNGLTVAANLTQNQTLAAAAEFGIQLNNLQLNTATTATAVTGLSDAEILARQNPSGLSDEEVISRQNAITAGLTDAARNQQSIRSLRNNKAQSTDWRVRLRLAPNSTYLYNDSQPGVLAALRATDGVIFPYTPSIDTAYKANYDTYDLVHSNYRGYFYKNSYVDIINLRATFTAQDTNEANYLLAVIHFFRSCTKMFYGKDPQRGSPPPLVYLSGYGDYQFNEHPCVISQFNYQLPPDVDYIRAQNVLSNNTNLQLARLRNPIANNPLAYSVNRLLNSKLLPGALDPRPATTNNLADSSPTYVPTKMEISIAMLPVQSRSNISQNFSVQGFANGNLLRGGYW